MQTNKQICPKEARISNSLYAMSGCTQTYEPENRGANNMATKDAGSRFGDGQAFSFVCASNDTRNGPIPYRASSE